VTLQAAPTTIFVRGAKGQKGGIWFEGELSNQQGVFLNGKQMDLYINGVFETATLTYTKYIIPGWLDGHFEFSLDTPLGTYQLQVKFPGDANYGPSETPVYPVDVTEEKDWISWEIIALAGILVVGGIVALQFAAPARVILAMPAPTMVPITVK